MTAAPPFVSILFGDPGDCDGVDDRVEPDFFADLNLDQVVTAVTRGRDDYQLAPFFYAPAGLGTVAYRHEVFYDLQIPAIREVVTDFGKHMRTVRRYLDHVRRLRYAWQKQLWFVDAVAAYSTAISRLDDQLGQLPIRSRGLGGLRNFVQSYAGGADFTERAAEAQQLRDRLAAVRYTVDIRGDRIRVGRLADEPDYSAEVADMFARFRHGEVTDYRATFHEPADMNHVEATVLQYVAGLHRELFDAVAAFGARHGGFLDPVITGFDRQVQFYLAWIDYADLLDRHGLRFCLPEISPSSKGEHVTEGFDVALADKLLQDGRPVICNDLDLRGDERILVISGPNQGGKTTYARMAGQLHHLARLGCPVPGVRARLFLTDRIFTHFERAESATDLHGKLEDDLLRVHDILAHATGDSLVIMNEIFTSTALQDAVYLGDKIVNQLIDLDCLGVYVTFVDELSRLDPATVSMVSTVDEQDTARRTFKVVRRPADGLSYALSIAGKYGLTYAALKERIR